MKYLTMFYPLIALFVCSLSVLIICTGISYIIDAKGRYNNYTRMWDDEDIEKSK